MPRDVDGSIIVGVDLNISQAEKKLSKLESDIESTEKNISDLTAKRDEAQQSGVFQAGVLDEEKMKLEEIKSRLKEAKAIASDKSADAGTRQAFKEMIPNIQTELSDQQTRVRALQTEWNQTEASVKKYDNQLMTANMELDQQKEAYGQLASQIEKANGPAARFGRNLRQAGEDVETLHKRIKRLASRVFVFIVITMGLRAMRTWMLKAIKTDDQATKAIAQLKGALLTMVQPLLSVVIPAFITLVNVLTAVANTIAQLISSIFGTTVDQSAEAAKNLNDEQKALSGVGSAAKKAGKSMAAFDEINQISNNSAGSGGAGATETEIAPDFSFMDSMTDKLKEKLDEISKAVLFIGTGFLLWKIGSSLPGILGSMASTLGLIMIAVGGIVVAWDGLTDAWENGVDWVNMAEMIGGVAIAAFALYQVFGPIGAGIALVVGGLVMLVTAFHDAFENGWNLQNTLLAIAGIFATGLGIAFLTGSIIPVLIASIAGILLGITVLTGHGGELLEGLRTIFEGITGFFKNAIEKDWKAAFASLGTAFEGIGIVFGAVIAGIKDFFINFLIWLDEKTGGKFHDIIETLIISIEWIYTSVKEVLDGIIDFISGVFTGDWKRVWKGIVKIFDGIIGVLATPFITVLNLIIDGLNALIRGMNKISFKAPDWVPGIGGKQFGPNIPQIPKIQVPKLAQGAVIPPNREFLAVLGDQKSGTNIEAPTSAIEEAVAKGIIAAGGAGGNRDITIILQLDRREFGRAVYKANSEESQRVGVKLVGGHA